MLRLSGRNGKQHGAFEEFLELSEEWYEKTG